MVKLLKPAIERRLEKADFGIGMRKRANKGACRSCALSVVAVMWDVYSPYMM